MKAFAAPRRGRHLRVLRGAPSGSAGRTGKGRRYPYRFPVLHWEGKNGQAQAGSRCIRQQYTGSCAPVRRSPVCRDADIRWEASVPHRTGSRCWQCCAACGSGRGSWRRGIQKTGHWWSQSAAHPNFQKQASAFSGFRVRRQRKSQSWNGAAIPIPLPIVRKKQLHSVR